MSNNVLTFPGSSPKRGKAIEIASDPDEDVGWGSVSRPYTRRGPNMHTFLFRSRELILESDEADLVRDVCRNIDRAQTKLRQLRERLQGERERSAALIELLTTAETKLSAAIVAALLSNREV
jgi:cell division FtsZ-interacting protein ZapD